MKKRKNWFLLGIYVLVVIINVLSRYSRGFGNQVRRSVFYMTQYIQGHISSLFPFSLGDYLLILAVILAAGALVLAAVLLSVWVAGVLKVGGGTAGAGHEKVSGENVDRGHEKVGGETAGRDHEKVGGVTAGGNHGKRSRCSGRSKILRFAGGYFYGLLWIIGVVSVIMSINCFVLYHCSSFQENYMPKKGREYHVGELAAVRDHVVRQCNELAEMMERDENGFIVYQGDIGQRAVSEMKRLGEEYPLLDGYYPVPKEFAFSGFFSQQYIMRYYFPFSMEANYNGKMYIANVPSTICHELSHVKGFIYEDDANFIGYLACTTSEDAFFRYSGYLSVLDYLNRDLYENLGRSREAYLTYETCSPLVESDNIFLTRQAWEEVESNAVISMETVKQASRSFLETNLQVNGIEEGIASYGDVVERLLVYYDGELY